MARVTNRSLEKPRDPNRLIDVAQFLAGALLLICAGMVYASQRAEALAEQTRIVRLQEELARLRQEHEILAVQLATELDPHRLEERARAFAGLTDPQPDRVAMLAPAPEQPLRVWLAAEGPGDGHR